MCLIQEGRVELRRAEGRVAARLDAGRRGEFGEALRRAEAGREAAERADLGRIRRRGEGQALASGLDGARGQEGRASGPVGANGEGGEGGAARGATGDKPAGWSGAGASGPGDGPVPAATAAAGAAPAGGSGGTGASGALATPELAALAQVARALPPVIETFQASGQPALSLDFGAALGVELRAAPDGVEVTLAASPALRPAARAELAGLCRTLAARGVAVASAEVRGRAPRRGRP